jgi:hypothetical protein
MLVQQLSDAPAVAEQKQEQEQEGDDLGQYDRGADVGRILAMESV